jgi:hypothetical protein
MRWPGLVAGPIAGVGDDEAGRAISTGQLHALLHFHFRPIDVVVCHGPDRETSFQGGFPA